MTLWEVEMWFPVSGDDSDSTHKVRIVGSSDAESIGAEAKAAVSKYGIRTWDDEIVLKPEANRIRICSISPVSGVSFIVPAMDAAARKRSTPPLQAYR